MAENEGRGGSTIPWANVMALLAALGGIFSLVAPVRTSRPPDPPGVNLFAGGIQTVDSRLWQDPFEEVDKEVARRGDTKITTDESRNTLVRLAGEIGKRHRKGGVQVVFGLLAGGPNSEPRERRLRTRTAVVEGLATCGFAPADAEHLGYTMIAWPAVARLPESAWPGQAVALPAVQTAMAQVKPAKAKSAKVMPTKPANTVAAEDPPEEGRGVADFFPFEWFQRTVLKNKGETRELDEVDYILVCWMRETALDLPLHRLAWLSAQLGLAGEDVAEPRRVRTTVLGPSSSGGVTKILAEASEAIIEPVRRELREMEIISCSATAPDEAFLVDPWLGNETLLPQSLSRQEADRRSRGAVARRIEEAFPVTFHRTIPNDGEILWESIRELKRRGVYPEGWASYREDGRVESRREKDPVALVSEHDTFYGRTLPVTFRQQCTGENFTDLIEGRESGSGSWIKTFQYQRGLDGRLPGDAVAKPGSEAEEKKAARAAESVVAGRNQTDYLLRLAEMLKAEDVQLRRAGSPGFRAIGVLGSDVYDKLLILRALRPKFPGVVFFTNNLDAQLAQPAEWKAAHNLVVVSPFGLHLHPRWQQKIPPFRDSYQTGAFLGTLLARAQPPARDLPGLMDVPRVFEIGRRGARDLSVNLLGSRFEITEQLQQGQPTKISKLANEPVLDQAELPRIYPLRGDLGKWWDYRHWLPWSTPSLGSAAGLLGICLLGLLLLLWLTTGRVTSVYFPGEPPTRDQWLVRYGRSTPANVCSAAVFGLLLMSVCGYFMQQVEGEPFAWLQGLSVWPGVALRVAALGLCGHFVVKACLLVRASDRAMSARFALPFDPPADPRGNYWSRLWTNVFRPLQVKYFQNRAGSDISFRASTLWRQYALRGWWGYRLLRVSCRLLFYAGACLAVIYLLGGGLLVNPARGALAMAFDRWSFACVLLAVSFLSLFVFDALQLNVRFIRVFSAGATFWPNELLQRSPLYALLGKQAVAQQLDIQLIAQRTADIGELVLYPFYVAALLVVSRAPYFDDYGWPPGIVFALAVNLLLPTLGALAMRRAAELAREDALRRLCETRPQLVASADPAADKHLKCLDTLIAEITGLKEGAFASFSHQPVVRALLYPAGGVGLWELARQSLA